MVAAIEASIKTGCSFDKLNVINSAFVPENFSLQMFCVKQNKHAVVAPCPHKHTYTHNNRREN